MVPHDITSHTPTEIHGDGFEIRLEKTDIFEVVPKVVVQVVPPHLLIVFHFAGRGQPGAEEVVQGLHELAVQITLERLEIIVSQVYEFGVAVEIIDLLDENPVLEHFSCELELGGILVECTSGYVFLVPDCLQHSLLRGQQLGFAIYNGGIVGQVFLVLLNQICKEQELLCWDLQRDAP